MLRLASKPETWFAADTKVTSCYRVGNISAFARSEC